MFQGLSGQKLSKMVLSSMHRGRDYPLFYGTPQISWSGDVYLSSKCDKTKNSNIKAFSLRTAHIYRARNQKVSVSCTAYWPPWVAFMDCSHQGHPSHADPHCVSEQGHWLTQTPLVPRPQASVSLPDQCQALCPLPVLRSRYAPSLRSFPHTLLW